uniref:Tetraacyldisaccharide 4'-kinase n=1 Tax=Roseihalotalea indica TaxID=2867963 RepID=A0AA49JEU5_9BACT|nr:tetraacyldisaccharide 4'-kinase [Tunicatimonas sp. TK19036]
MANSTNPKQTSASKAGQVLLWPLTAIYGGITRLRNHLYNIGYSKSLSFTPFIISVGNLSVGGTGKTPMIEYLTDWLTNASYSVAILSRGYGRKTQGVRLATSDDSADTLGDEPYQFYRKYHQQGVVVAVAEERVLGVPEIMHHHPKTQIILLDDAFQHRAIARDLNLLLTRYSRPFYQDWVLPAGRLRESRSGAKRADAVIVTKCPDDLDHNQQKIITENIRKYTRTDTPVFFTGIHYGAPRPVFEGITMPEQVIAFSGIAHPELFQQYVRQHFLTKECITFADHYRYTENDIKKLSERARQEDERVCFMTTEKDMVKMINSPLADQWKALPLFYLPIQSYFLQEETAFQTWVTHQMTTSTQS